MRFFVLLLAASCADISGFDGNPQMYPGQTCLNCHSAGGPASGLAFNVAGTVYPTALAENDGGLFGATVTLVDANGNRRTMETNGAGNFYNADPVIFPITVSIQVGKSVFTMQQPPPNGDCNSCHAIGPSGAGLAPIDAGVPGYTAPGHLYAFAGDGGCAEPEGSCPSPAPSFATQVYPILEGACFPCHLDADQCGFSYPDGGGSCGVSPAIDSYAVVATLEFATMLSCYMPPSSAFAMSPDELQIVFDWLQCGRPNN
jgi:hypothetical protein